MSRLIRTPLVVMGAALALLVSGCGSDEPSGGGDGDATKIAAIFSGPTNDNDYNALGLAALQAA